jgi:tetratricopeptide (TPR) repeat protein
MHKFHFFLAMGAWLIAVSAAAALDSIKTKSGVISGKIIRTSPLKVEIEQNDASKEIAVNQIENITYDSEPYSLKEAKKSIRDEKYEDALKTLGHIKSDDISRKELLEDIDFYNALVASHLALNEPGKIADAGRLMIAFIKKYPDSYHYFQACEIVGNLLVENRSYAEAEDYYAKVAKAPWQDYQFRAAVAMGRVLLAQDKRAEALKTFENVLANPAEGPLSKPQIQAAKIGKAAVLAAMKQNDKAVELVETLIRQADPEDADTLARCYNVLGTALRQSGKDKEAMLAFMHVDLLYPSVSDAHAEALYNLAELWDKLHKTERAVRARQILVQQYKTSPWAQKLDQ